MRYDKAENQGKDKQSDKKKPPQEIGGRKGPDPARYGDWEVGGKCVDF